MSPGSCGHFGPAPSFFISSWIAASMDVNSARRVATFASIAARCGAVVLTAQLAAVF